MPTTTKWNLAAGAGLLAAGMAIGAGLLQDRREPPRGAAPAAGDKAADDRDALRRLMVERRDAWKAAVEAKMAEVRAGRVQTDMHLIETLRGLRDAELDLTTKPAERVKAHEVYEQATLELERVVQERIKAGVGSAAESPRVRALRVEAQIDLLREKMRAAEGKKGS
jgi:hypothetical protein